MKSRTFSQRCFSAVTILVLAGISFGCTHRGPRTHSLRLLPGQDVRMELEKFTAEQKLKAGVVVSAVGSLSQSSLRLANQKTSTTKAGPFEIVSLSGTLSPDGPHLHLSISDATGTTIGGHLTEGNLVYTTLELLILEPESTSYHRSLDAATGSKELQITR